MSVSIARILGFAAAAAFASAGLMQAAPQGAFHLPVAAHWGSVVLEPGDYRLSLPDTSLGERTFRIAGYGKTILELPIATDVQKQSKTSRLELWQIDGTYFIRQFSSGPSGKTFTFSVPKTRSHEEIARVGITNSTTSRDLP